MKAKEILSEVLVSIKEARPDTNDYALAVQMLTLVTGLSENANFELGVEVIAEVEQHDGE